MLFWKQSIDQSQVYAKQSWHRTVYYYQKNTHGGMIYTIPLVFIKHMHTFPVLFVISDKW